MKTSRDEWESRIRSATEVPFSADLQERILQTAVRLETPKTQRKPSRQGHVRTWMAAGGGLAAALLMAVTVWRIGTPLSTPTSPTTAAANSVASAPVNRSGTASNVPNASVLNSVGKLATAASALGLPAASLQVKELTIASSHSGGPKDEIVATLKNTGRNTINKQDVYGVLTFSKQPKAAKGGPPDWLTFVNGPDKPIAPGQSASWIFQPTTAPIDVKGNLTEPPQLSFYQAGLVPLNQASTTWNTAAVQASGAKVNVQQTWASGESFQVHVQVRNTSSKPIQWSNLFAVVWFNDQSQANGDFTGADVPRFLTRVQGPASAPRQILPGQSVNLSLDLEGGATPNLPNLAGHVLFVDGVH